MVSEKAAAEMLELSRILNLESTFEPTEDADQDSETLLTEILQHVQEARNNHSMFFDAVFSQPTPPRITWTGRPLRDILLDILAANELVENLLGFVEHNTLLQCRDVSGQFRALIDTSPTLQRRLFLLPDFSYTYPEPLRVLEIFPNGRGSAYLEEVTDADDLLISLNRRVHFSINAPYMKLPPQNPIWYRMLVTQPPIKTLSIFITWHWDCQRAVPGGGPPATPLEVICESGVTLDLLYEALQSHIDFHNLNCPPTCESGRTKKVKHFGGSFAAGDSLTPSSPILLCEEPSGENSNKSRRFE